MAGYSQRRYPILGSERQLKGTIKLQTPVHKIQRVDGFVRVVTDNADAAFDAVILACHAIKH